MRRAVLLAASATLAALSIVAGASAYDGLFAPNSYRNAALPSNAPIDPFSRIYVNDLTSKVSRLGVYVNTTVFSTPVYTAAEGAPSITVDSTGGPGQPADWPGVPLSSSAQPAAGTDKWLTVYQPNSAGGTVWEFWHYDPNGGQPLADS